MRPFKTVFLRLIALVLACSLGFAGPPHGLGGQRIRINGSGTGLEMMKPLIQAYALSEAGTTFELGNPLGSSGAIKALLSGALDIAVISKPLRPEETAQGLVLVPFGRTPLAIVTGRNVPIKDISTEQLEGIYSGRVRKWSNGENIRVVLRPQEDIDTKILRGLSPGMDEAITLAQGHRGMLTAVTDPEANLMVASMAGSIGTSGLAGILVERLPVNILSLNGVEPAIATLAEGRYPLGKDIHFVTRTPVPASAQRFLEFVESEKGRAIVRKIGVLASPSGQ